MTIKTKEPSSGNLIALTGIHFNHSKLYLGFIYNKNKKTFLCMNNSDGISNKEVIHGQSE